MGYFISPPFGYYEGDRYHALDLEVPQRPTPDHVWNGFAWVVDAKLAHNKPIDAKIAALEAGQLAPRFSREGILGSILKDYMRSNPTLTQAQAIANLTAPGTVDYNLGFTRLKAFDDQIVALRAQRL